MVRQERRWETEQGSVGGRQGWLDVSVGRGPVARMTKEDYMEDTGVGAMSRWDPENGAQCLFNSKFPSHIVIDCHPPPHLSPLQPPPTSCSKTILDFPNLI